MESITEVKSEENLVPNKENVKPKFKLFKRKISINNAIMAPSQQETQKKVLYRPQRVKQEINPIVKTELTDVKPKIESLMELKPDPRFLNVPKLEFGNFLQMPMNFQNLDHMGLKFKPEAGDNFDYLQEDIRNCECIGK